MTSYDPPTKVAVAEDLNQLRPINILPTLSKIMEKLVNIKFQEHLDINNLMPITQSGFRRFQGTNTGLLNICSNAGAAIDASYWEITVLIDYSRAFDEIFWYLWQCIKLVHELPS